MPARESGHGTDAIEGAGGEQTTPGFVLRLVLDSVGRHSWRRLTIVILALVVGASEVMTVLFMWAFDRPLEYLGQALLVAAAIALLLATPTIAVSLRLIAHLHDVQTRLQQELARTKALEIRLRELANIDETTGILNRRAFRASGHALLSYAQRHELPVSLLALDLDGFKSLNDRRGHPAGDRALRTVAEILRDIVRGHDPIARLGGDEFVIMLQGTDLSGAVAVAERIRNTIATTMGGLTVSVGVAVGAGEVSFDDLMVRADRALYDAKRKGRNKVSFETRTFTEELDNEDQHLDTKSSLA